MKEGAERAFRALGHTEGQFSLLLDANFDIIWHSESLTAMLGWDDLCGRSSIEFVHPDDLELTLKIMLQIHEADEVYNTVDAAYSPESADIRILDASGAWRPFETVTFNYLEDPEIGGVLCTCKVIKDRSDLALAIELLGSGADTEEVLPVVARLADRSMGGDSRCAIAWREGTGSLVVTAAGEAPVDQRLADAAALVWSLSVSEPLAITELDDPRLGGVGAIAAEAGFRAAFLVPIEAPNGQDVIGAMVAWGSTTVDFHIARQSPIHVALRLAALSIADSRTKRELRWAASHDPLTGLVNRAKFAQRLDEMAHDDLVLLYIDLDDFKPINDMHGHPVGDCVLIEVGRRISNVIGPCDLVGRLGGDEFAVVCAGTNDPVHGRDIADRIIEVIREPIFTNGLRLRVGASVGVAVGAQPLIPAVLVQRADEALYAAKHSGKNTVCLAR
ncbi:MAG TPA: GGDEF domain-containing protein [Ilumatobacteraceae bacterium]